MFVCVLRATHANSHELIEQRELILSLSPDGVELLVAYELPGGVQAARLRQWMDLDKDGIVSSEGLEFLARAQLLIPRLASGIEVLVNDDVLPLSLVEVNFADGAGSNEEMGFAGMAIYVWTSPVPIDSATVELRVAENAPAVIAHAQTTGDLAITDSTVPRAPDAPVIGPVNVVHRVPLRVTVESTETAE